MRIATKTLEAIDWFIKIDQGSKYRGYLKEVLPDMHDAYRTDDEEFREHLGASIIGGKCSREIWYGFRWAHAPKFDGQILRLFNRGHLEEGRFIAILKTIGMEVYYAMESGKQFRARFPGGHFGGSLDGVGINCPDLGMDEDNNPIPCLLEFKTHNDKSFKSLKEKGVRVSKPEHYIQMQIYMYKYDLDYGLYLAVNKNDDELHAEIIEADRRAAEIYIQRANEIVRSPRPLPKISNNAGWWECRFCNFKNICHHEHQPQRNCRTCKYSQPVSEGMWYCNLHNQHLDTNLQLASCANYDPLF